MLFIFGIISWYATGIDDLIIFSHIYSFAGKTNNKISSIIGLEMAVIAMIAIVYFAGLYLSDILKNWTFIGFIVPLYLGIKSWREVKTEKQNAGTNNFFILAFLGYAFNCTDDIVYNTAIILGKVFISKLMYLAGIFAGANLMIVVASLYHQKIKDCPKIRAIILFAVSFYILASRLAFY